MRCIGSIYGMDDETWDLALDSGDDTLWRLH